MQFYIEIAVINYITNKKMVISEPVLEKTSATGEKANMMPLAIRSGLLFLILVCLLRMAIDSGIKMLTPTMLMESYKNMSADIANRISSSLVIFSVLGIFVSRFVQKKITHNEVKAQFLLYSASVLPLVVACFVGKLYYVWILVALALVILINGGASPFSQSFVSVRFEKYGRIGTVSGILNAGASVGNILASYIFAWMSEVMSWQGVAVSWVCADVICVVICISVLPRWSRFLTE